MSTNNDRNQDFQEERPSGDISVKIVQENT